MSQRAWLPVGLMVFGAAGVACSYPLDEFHQSVNDSRSVVDTGTLRVDSSVPKDTASVDSALPDTTVVDTSPVETSAPETGEGDTVLPPSDAFDGSTPADADGIIPIPPGDAPTSACRSTTFTRTSDCWTCCATSYAHGASVFWNKLNSCLCTTNAYGDCPEVKNTLACTQTCMDSAKTSPEKVCAQCFLRSIDTGGKCASEYDQALATDSTVSLYERCVASCPMVP